MSLAGQLEGAHGKQETSLFDPDTVKSAWSKQEGDEKLAEIKARVFQKQLDRINEANRAKQLFHDRRTRSE